MNIPAFFQKLAQDLRASYWFIPTALICLAFVLSQAVLWIDRNPDVLGITLPIALQSTQVEGARALMAIISQSVFGVAGVMFSMTIVAVSFASGNFGPRLISNFMRDRGNQWSLGILVATFVFALMVTRAIQSPTVDEAGTTLGVFVPHLSILVALVLTLLSVFTVVFFVHHIPETINVSNISAGLGRRLVSDIKLAIETQISERKLDPGSSDLGTAPFEVLAGCNGYIQALNFDKLNALAEKHAIRIAEPLSVGTFVTDYTVILKVYGDTPEDQLEQHLKACFAFGDSKTDSQNLLFLVEQLVEMIVRALSPGVNDPFTAINCLNWISATLVVAANHKGGLSPVDSKSSSFSTPSFEKLLQTAIGASCSYAKDDPLTDRHLRLLLAKLRTSIEHSEHAEVLENFIEENDLQ